MLRQKKSRFVLGFAWFDLYFALMGLGYLISLKFKGPPIEKDDINRNKLSI